MQTIEKRLEIQFSQDRQHWHDGPAERGSLFFRTRAVIGGVPTEWKTYCLPACFIGAPIPTVWQMIKDMEPIMTVEEYDTMCAVTEAIRELIAEQ